MLFRALPGGISAAICASVAMYMSRTGWPIDLCSTLAVLSVGTVCWFVLLRTCLPFNRIRLALLVTVAAVFGLSFLLLDRIFFLSTLTVPALTLYAALAALGGSLIWLCDRLLRIARK